MSESKWIPVKTRLPEPNEPFWLFWNGPGYIPVTIHKGAKSHELPCYFGDHPNITHWMPAEIPAPPVIKSPAELAWEKSCQRFAAMQTNYKDCYIAGFEDGLSEGRKG